MRRSSPFTSTVPDRIRPALIALQADRLHAILPLLCLTIAACALAMTIAVLGDLPAWQQFTPPTIIVGLCLFALYQTRKNGIPATTDAALGQFQTTVYLAGGLGLISSLWSVNAFTETEKYYCMVAPVFIGIAALVSTTCLLSVPRAAIAGIVATITPIVIKMMLYDNMGVRAMAAMLALVGLMQSGVVLAKFRETVSMLELQDRLNRLAESDSLTGLDNRLCFLRKLDCHLENGQRVLVALADLDGFKAINDTHGHQAGDAILAEAARRMRADAPRALSVARLGGDEFALLFDDTHGDAHAAHALSAIAASVPLPVFYQGAALSVGLSIGTAKVVDHGTEAATLLAEADSQLYANKASRKRHLLPLAAA